MKNYYLYFKKEQENEINELTKNGYKIYKKDYGRITNDKRCNYNKIEQELKKKGLDYKVIKGYNHNDKEHAYCFLIKEA